MFRWIRGIDPKETQKEKTEAKPSVGLSTIDLNPFGTSDRIDDVSEAPTLVSPELPNDSATEVWQAFTERDTREGAASISRVTADRALEFGRINALMVPSLRRHANRLRIEADTLSSGSPRVLWEEYLQLMPTDSGAWLSLGEHHLVHGEIKAAEIVFREAVDRRPSDGICKGALGHTLMILGELMEARKLLEAACELLPHELGLQETLLACLKAAGDEDAIGEQLSRIEDMRRGTR